MKNILLFSLLILLFASCSTNYDGKYSYPDKSGIVYINIDGDELQIWDEDQEGKKGGQMKAKFHINENNNIILDNVISAQDFYGNEVDKNFNKGFIKRWNAVGIKIQNNTIYLYEDLDRNDDLMKFMKE